jgi:predicted Zn-dependent protease
MSGKIAEAANLRSQRPNRSSGVAGNDNAPWATLTALDRTLFGIPLPSQNGQAKVVDFPVRPSAEDAIALSLAGESAAAKNLMDELIKMFPQDTLLNSVWIPAAKAALAIRAGNGAAAINELGSAIPYEPGTASLVAIYLRGLAYLQTRSGRQAAAEFQKINDHRGVDSFSVLHPLSHLGLARAYALIGDVTKARNSYQSFLAIWEDADPRIPVLIDEEYKNLPAN